MAAGRGQVEAIISIIGEDKITQIISDVEKGLKGVEDSTKRGAQETKGFRESWQMAAVGINAAMDIANKMFTGIKKGLEAVQEGARAMAIEAAFNRAVGPAADLLHLMKQATAQTIDTTSLQRMGAMAQRAGIPLSQIPKIMNLATKGAVATGKNMRETVETVLQSFVKMNDRGLKSLDINVDLGKSMLDHARSLGRVSAQDLTLTERRVKLFDLIANGLGDVYSQIDLGEDISVKLAQQTAKWENLKSDMQVALAEGVGDWAQWLSAEDGLAGFLSDVNMQLAGSFVTMRNLGLITDQTAKELLATLQPTEEQLRQLADAQAEVDNGTDRTAEGISGLVNPFLHLSLVYDRLAGNTESFSKEILLQSDALRDEALATRDSTAEKEARVAAEEKSKAAMEESAKAALIITEATQGYTEASKDAVAAAVEKAIGESQAAEDLANAAVAQGNYTIAIKHTNTALKAAEKAGDAYSVTAARLKGNVRELKEEQIRYTESLLEAMITTVVYSAMADTEATHSASGVAESMARGSDAAVLLTGKLSKLHDELAKMDKKKPRAKGKGAKSKLSDEEWLAEKRAADAAAYWREQRIKSMENRESYAVARARYMADEKERVRQEERTKMRAHAIALDEIKLQMAASDRQSFDRAVGYAQQYGNKWSAGFAASASIVKAEGEKYNAIQAKMTEAEKKKGAAWEKSAPSMIAASGAITAAFIEDAQKQAAIQSAFEVAAGIAALAWGTPMGAALHFLSAAMYAAVAATTEGAKGGGGAGGGRSAGKYTPTTMAPTPDQGQGEGTTAITLNISGTIVGNDEEAGRQLASMIRREMKWNTTGSTGVQ